MGKIRVKTIGDDSAEKKQKEEARKRAEAKKVEKQQEETTGSETIVASPTETDTSKEKPKKRYQKKTTPGRSQKYQTVVGLVDKNKNYSLSEALSLLPKLKIATFDETVELHVNTVDKSVSGSITLPHGTGKKVRVAVANQAEDPKSVDELIKVIESGKIDFDILVATPDAMPKLARVARLLGPRGLMPNPKNGTITPKPENVAKQYEDGQMNFKTEAKFPIIHMTVGKVSFGEEKLTDNIKTALDAIPQESIRTITLKSTMSPGIKLAVTI